MHLVFRGIRPLCDFKEWVGIICCRNNPIRLRKGLSLFKKKKKTSKMGIKHARDQEGKIEIALYIYTL